MRENGENKMKYQTISVNKIIIDIIRSFDRKHNLMNYMYDFLVMNLASICMDEENGYYYKMRDDIVLFISYHFSYDIMPEIIFNYDNQFLEFDLNKYVLDKKSNDNLANELYYFEDYYKAQKYIEAIEFIRSNKISEINKYVIGIKEDFSLSIFTEEKIDLNISKEYYDIRKNKQNRIYICPKELLNFELDDYQKSILRYFSEYLKMSNSIVFFDEGIYINIEGIEIQLNWSNEDIFLSFKKKDINGFVFQENIEKYLSYMYKKWNSYTINKKLKLQKRMMNDIIDNDYSLDKLYRMFNKFNYIPNNMYKDMCEDIELKYTIPTSYIMTSNEFINSYNKTDLKDIKRNFIENIKYYYHDIIKEYVNKISFESDGINHSFKMIFNKCLIEIVYTKIFNIYIYYKENKKIVVKPLSDYLYNFYSKEERIINWVNGINNKKPFNVDENIKKLVVPFYYEDDESIIKLMEDIKE